MHIMKEHLVPKNNTNTAVDYSLIFIVLFVTTYTTIIALIYIDIHKMSNNLDKIIDLINVVNVNTTEVNSIRQDTSIIKDCILNKYCRRV